MAPSRPRLASAYAPSADVRAIGLLAFQLLAGVSYWHTARLKGARLREIIGEVLFGVLESAGARARAFGAPGTLPEGFDEWFARCVVRTPKARFPHAREALDALRAIRRRALEQSSRATEVDPASRFREAAAYTREARYELALAAVDDALLLAPKVPEYRVLRARCLLALGQRERARNEVAGVLLRHPDHVAALFVHGDASLAAGAVSQAALDYTAVLMRDPRRVEALTARAKAFLAMGRFHDAHCDLECANTIAPDDEVVRRSAPTCADSSLRSRHPRHRPHDVGRPPLITDSIGCSYPGRTAKSRMGGESSWCYPRDVPHEAIDTWREEHETRPQSLGAPAR